jgi:hypothetical protein
MAQEIVVAAEDRSVTDQPIYWFCLLEEAMDRGDLEAAAAAQRELARLGVRVAYRRDRPGKAVAHA